MKREPFGAVRRVSLTLTMAFVDDGEQWHIASFTTKPEALAYLASLGYCVHDEGKYYLEA